jgi:hypothetical protein
MALRRRPWCVAGHKELRLEAFVLYDFFSFLIGFDCEFSADAE